MNITTRIPTGTDLTLTQLLNGASLSEALARVAGDIRQEPANAARRMAYFDLLCLTGAWEKALPVLQTAVDMDAALTPVAYVCRQLVQAERFRAAVFAGSHQPAFSLTVDTDNSSAASQDAAWLPGMWQALCAENTGRQAEADSLRLAALDEAEDCAGEALCVDAQGKEVLHSFNWLTDSDSRLGPALEAFVGGRYAWLPLARIRHLRLHGPRCLRDVLWLPATLTMAADNAQGQEEYTGFVPGRYPGSEHAGDALALGRETRWQDVGETGTLALGQKALMSNVGDLNFYDLRRLTLPNSQGGMR